MIQITAIRLAGGKAHERITDVRWRSASTSAGQTTREAIVDWLSVSSANPAVVGSITHQLRSLRENVDNAWR